MNAKALLVAATILMLALFVACQSKPESQADSSKKSTAGGSTKARNTDAGRRSASKVKPGNLEKGSAGLALPAAIPEELPPPPPVKIDTIDLGKGAKLDLVEIPAGSFMMGSPDSEVGRTDSSESPRHQVELDTFWMGKTEVTQAQYDAVLGTNPSTEIGPNKPVNNLSWAEAMGFCRKLSQETHMEFTLPTEAQWEYACRAQTTTAFNTGNTISTAQANFTADKGAPPLKDAGVLPPNRWGLSDMHGNVWEWCRDWFDSGFYQKSPARNPENTEQAGSPGRVMRGGSVGGTSVTLRSASRAYSPPEHKNYNIGFRVVRMK